MTEVDALELMTAQDAAALVGVELRGKDGQPFHCGERMEVRGGIVGIDFARCKCGVQLCRPDSPHINGGFAQTDDWYERQGNRLWFATQPNPDQEAGA